MPDSKSRYLQVLKQFIVSLSCTLILCSARGQAIYKELHAGWRFRKAGDKEWMPATVPGTIHTDLLGNNKIPDPFFGDNEALLQWIDTCDWEYEAYFNIVGADLRSRNELLFEGLDTYAEVYLNDSLILSADNMFRSWHADCGRFLKEGKNRLFIRFGSAVNRGKEEAKKLSYVLPGEEKVFTRKAQYQYGWDWGPRFVTCGIWKPVKLVSWNTFKINHVHLNTIKLDDGMASLSAEINVTAEQVSELTFEVMIEETGRLISGKKSVSRGVSKIIFHFDIANPRRWWCNGLGEPFLYHFSVAVYDSNEQPETRKLNFGLRTIELVQESDSIGKGFFFRLNGVPVFMKGANWIPADNFLPRITKEKYNMLLLAAKEANMNMLRVWGGGVYEADPFYYLCDSLGILVWQDFMFACAMYPGDDHFTENIKSEIKEQVIRLRNHPCIALWCGNNEIDEGWKNWGWQRLYNYSEMDSTTIWNNYTGLFHQLIPAQLALLDPLRPYWASSPSIGWGHAESLKQGDSHYWGVWWGKEPFDTYRKKTGRFMSEYGFQGMPSMRTIRTFTQPADRTLGSNAMKSHQKHPVGFETIGLYMEDWYHKPKDFENYVYVSQLLQAEGMRIAIESHRRAKPFCMGSLYWQLNDCWPVTSWSSLDYHGGWKALHYAVRESFQKYQVSVLDTGPAIVVYVVSDDTSIQHGTLLISASDFSGSVLWTDSVTIAASPERAVAAFEFSKEKAAALFNPSRTVLNLVFRIKGIHAAEKIHYFKLPKDLQLEKPEIHYTTRRNFNGCTLTLATNSLARNVYLELPGEEPHFSDNYFDLLPGKSKTVSFDSASGPDEIRKNLVIKSLVDSF